MGRRADHIDEESCKVLARMEDESDPRLSCAALKSRIDHLQQSGETVPEALLIAQRQLMSELIAESQGR